MAPDLMAALVLQRVTFLLSGVPINVATSGGVRLLLHQWCVQGLFSEA